MSLSRGSPGPDTDVARPMSADRQMTRSLSNIRLTRWRSRILLILMALTFSASAVSADQTFTVTLTPVDTTVSSASGTATFVLNSSETVVTYQVNIAGLTTPEMGAHVHREGGGIAFDLGLGNHKSGTWTLFKPGDITLLKSGQMFVLIHTELRPTGELRGSIVSPTTPVDEATWGHIKALFR